MALTEQEELELLELENEAADGAPSQPAEHPILKGIGEAVSAATRGTRGLGVAAEHLVTKALPGGADPTFQQVLDRASAATRPGYEAPAGERLGAAIGESLPTVAAGPLAAIPVAGVVAGGERLAETGSPDLAARRAALAASIAALGSGTGVALQGATKAAGRTMLSMAKGVPRAITDDAMDIGGAGTREGVDRALTDVASRVDTARKTAGEYVAAARKAGGFQNPLEVEKLRQLGDLPRPDLQQTLRDTAELLKNPDAYGSPDDQAGLAMGLLDDIRTHQEIAKKATGAEYATGSLADQNISDWKQALNDVIMKSRAGRTVREAQGEYADMRSQLGEFSKQMRVPELAEETLLRIAGRGEGATGQTAAAARGLQNLIGEDALKAARGEVAMRRFATGSSDPGTWTRVALGAGTEGAQKVIGPAGVLGVQRSAEAAAGAPRLLAKAGVADALSKGDTSGAEGGEVMALAEDTPLPPPLQFMTVGQLKALMGRAK